MSNLATASSCGRVFQINKIADDQDWKYGGQEMGEGGRMKMDGMNEGRGLGGQMWPGKAVNVYYINEWV